MKKIVLLMALVFIGAVGWRVGENLSSDAVSMAVGLLLGVMAGIPTALLVLASDRRSARTYDDRDGARRRDSGLPTHYAPQPPVIVLTGQQGPVLPPGYGASHQLPHADVAWPAPAYRRQERDFRILGEQTDRADEW